MNSQLLGWFTTCWDTLSGSGRHRLLDTVLGPIRMIDDNERPLALNWPEQRIAFQTNLSDVAALGITTQQPPSELDRALQSPDVQRSRRRGRGAFPVSWRPGTPWIARFEDGPSVIRYHDQILVATTQSADRWANRVLREVLIHGGRRRGFTLCHCAVIATERGGVLVSGPSGAGKTDLALRLARQAHAHVVTVDRGIIGQRGGNLAVGTLPFALNIHHATLAQLGTLDIRLARRYPPINDKHYLDVRAAERYCQIRLLPWAHIAAVVSLQPLGKPVGEARWCVLDRAGITQAFGEADTADTDPGYQIDWLGMATGRATARWWSPAMTSLGWSLHYRPGQPLPDRWVEQVTGALHTREC